MSTKQIFLLLRPKHWIKNFFVFIPLFISGSFFDTSLLLNSFLGFVMFSISASIVYIFNDLIDIESDKNHPKKKNRPIASGNISIGFAIFLLITLFTLLILTGVKLNFLAIEIIFSYLAMNLAYSLYLKRIAIIDVFCISIGFVLRVIMGVLVTGLPVSYWIISLTFSLCLLLALGKRQAELNIVNGESIRPSLKKYNKELISSLQSVFVCATIIFYVMYTIFNETFSGNTDLLFYSSIFVAAGLCRYIFITTSDSIIDEPTNIVFEDRFIMLTVCSWIIYMFLILYI